MSDFTKEYRPGDILYGRFDYTQGYWNALLEERQDVFELFMKEETARSNCPRELQTTGARTFKDLSTKMQAHAKSGQTHAVISYFHKGFDDKLPPDENLKIAAKENPQIPPRFNKTKGRYHEALYKSRYSPFACIQIDQTTGVAGVATVGTYEKYLRRASKFGALNVGAVLGVRVHFVLDKIEMKDVLGKTVFPSTDKSYTLIPITTSELRTLFRNWDSAAGHVLFYLDQKRVKAPWDTEPAGWIEYAKRRCAKYSELLVKQNKKDKIVPFDDLKDAGALNRAADAMRRCITSPKD